MSYREGDSPEDISNARRRRIGERAATIFWSMVSAGLLALFIGWFNDLDQRERSVKNCQLVQEDRRDRADSVRETAERLDKSADFVLGDPTENPPVKKFKFKGTPFEDLKEFSISDAAQEREEAARNFERAEQIESRIEDCEKDVFPRPKFLGIF